MDIIKQIWSGQAGLAKTYWLYGMAASFVWGIALSMVTPGSLAAQITVGLLVVYSVIVNVGIWRSASRYEGPKVWAVLAKMAVAAIPALFIVGMIAAVSISMTKPTAKAPDAELKFDPSTAVLEPSSPYPGLKPFSGKLDGEAAPRSEIDAFLAAPPSLEEAKSWTQENTKSAEKGPWLSYAPTGSRFCRLSDRSIVIVYPPGVKPYAEPANVFCASVSVTSIPELGD